jgi:hypothetical protein
MGVAGYEISDPGDKQGNLFLLILLVLAVRRLVPEVQPSCHVLLVQFGIHMRAPEIGVEPVRSLRHYACPCLHLDVNSSLLAELP